LIALDTNVVVRYLTQDGENHQVRLANELFDSLSALEPGYLTDVVLAEVWWVMKRSYKLPTLELCEILDQLVSSTEILVRDEELVRKAVSAARSGGDFADALIALTARSEGCLETVTFDVGAAEFVGMRLLT